MAGVNQQLRTLLESGVEGVDPDEAVASFVELFEAAEAQAPALCSRWNDGVAALLRIAFVAPRQTWVRSPTEPWVPERGENTLLRRLLLEGNAGLERQDSEDALLALGALVRHLLCKYEDSALASVSGCFTWNDGGGVAFEDGSGSAIVMCSGPGLRLAMRFTRFYAAVGRGESVVTAAKEHLSPALTKKMVRQLVDIRGGCDDIPAPPDLRVPDSVHFTQPISVRGASPLAMLRLAQVVALGGTQRVARAAALYTKLGVDIGSPDEEEFAVTVLSWACRFSSSPELDEEMTIGMAMEWLLGEHATDPTFSVSLNGNPRSPKKVLAAAGRATQSLELRKLQATGELFNPNSAGIKGYMLRGVDVAFDPHCIVPTSEIYSPNSWQGDRYEPSEEEFKLLTDPTVRRKATIRVEEILSFEYLQYVGQNLQNCLQVERRGGSSLFKYLSRARVGESSFWVMTATPDDEDEGCDDRTVEHLLLVEVYNDLRVVHQAEGPHPRRWPRTDAWGWLREWATQEGLRPDGPEGVTVGPGGWDWDVNEDPWDIRRCFLW